MILDFIVQVSFWSNKNFFSRDSERTSVEKNKKRKIRFPPPSQPQRNFLYFAKSKNKIRLDSTNGCLLNRNIKKIKFHTKKCLRYVNNFEIRFRFYNSLLFLSEKWNIPFKTQLQVFGKFCNNVEILSWIIV